MGWQRLAASEVLPSVNTYARVQSKPRGWGTLQSTACMIWAESLPQADKMTLLHPHHKQCVTKHWDTHIHTHTYRAAHCGDCTVVTANLDGMTPPCT